MPTVAGYQNNVVIVRSSYGDMITKFSARSVIEKNMRVTTMLQTCGIPAPDVRMAHHDEFWVEVYPMIPGKTLQERMEGGMPDDDVRRAWNDIVATFIKMDKIPIRGLREIKGNTPYWSVYQHKKITHGKTVAVMTGAVYYLMNKGPASNLGLYHHDITPQNVIIDSDGKFKAFIDMDSVTICDRDFVLGAMGAGWQKMGYDINEMLDMVDELSQRRANRLRVKTLAAINGAGKYFFATAKCLKIK